MPGASQTMTAVPRAAAASQMHTIAGAAISITANAAARASQCQNSMTQELLSHLALIQGWPTPVGGPSTAELGAMREALKLSRATSAIPASDPIIAELSSGIRITFWFGVPARRPIASM